MLLGIDGFEVLRKLRGEGNRVPAMLILRAPRGDSTELPARIVSVFEPGQDFDGPFFDAYLSLADALALKSWCYNDRDLLERSGYDALTVRAASLNDAIQIVEQLEATGFQVTTLKVMLDMVNKGMIIVQTMLASVGSLALLVASIGIANTMVMAVCEGAREIGIFRSVGASSSDVRKIFVVEAALIGAMAGLAGVIGGWLLGLGLNELILAILRWQEIALAATFFVLAAWLVAAAMAFATIVGLLAGHTRRPARRGSTHSRPYATSRRTLAHSGPSRLRTRPVGHRRALTGQTS